MMERKTEYGEKFQEHLLEQYKLYVSLTDNASARRSKTNEYYSSLFSISIPLIAVGISEKILSDLIVIIISIIGLFLCAVWYLNIRSYKQLNTGRFKIIHQIEEHLPFECFKKEWDYLGNGKHKNKYFKLSSVEGFVPLIFSIPFIILFLINI